MTEQISIRLDKDVLGWLRLKALEENRSLSNMIAVLLKEAMEKDGEKQVCRIGAKEILDSEGKRKTLSNF